MRKEPGHTIPYVLTAIAALIFWPFTIGFMLTASITPLIKEKWHPYLAVVAIAVGIWFLILAKDYLGYDTGGSGVDSPD